MTVGDPAQRQTPSTPEARCIRNALPPWRSERRFALRIELDRDGFRYLHHPNPPADDAHLGNIGVPARTDSYDEEDERKLHQGKYLKPTQQLARLKALITGSRGGSILVTGYRGTGKTSLVNMAIQELRREQPSPPRSSSRREPAKRGSTRAAQGRNYVPIYLNLTTTRNATDLTWMMIKQLVEARDHLQAEPAALSAMRDRLERCYERTVKQQRERRGSDIRPRFEIKVPGLRLGAGVSSSESYEEAYEPYTLHEAQKDLLAILALASRHGNGVIFVFDEIDKLIPKPDPHEPSTVPLTLREIETIVADLKFLLTQSSAFQIFIAGKDVDDRWTEDLNKGEGLFESVFMQNVYMPSLFTLESNRDWAEASEGGAKPPAPPWQDEAFIALFGRLVGKSERRLERDLDEFFRMIDEAATWLRTRADHLILTQALGIPAGFWPYNVGRLVLPYLAPAELLRLYYSISPPAAPGGAIDDMNVVVAHLYHALRSTGAPADRWGHTREKYEEQQRLQPATARLRRNLRHFIAYLTYKGRGIPRKVLREFYSFVRPEEPCDTDNTEVRLPPLYLSVSVQEKQRVRFFAALVQHLGTRHHLFVNIGDKAAVATFHLMDHILKLHRTVFTWRDIQRAAIITDRQELLPEPTLVSNLVQLFEGFLIERIRPEQRAYRVLPTVRREVAEIYRRFAQEQTELRFTQADFPHELSRLLEVSHGAQGAQAATRLETIEAQERLGEIWYLLGQMSQARLEWAKTWRMIDADLRAQRRGSEDQRPDILAPGLDEVVQIGVRVLQRIGLLAEHERDLGAAKLYYERAIRLQQSAWDELASGFARAGNLLVPPYRQDGSAPSAVVARTPERDDRLVYEDRLVQDMVPLVESSHRQPFHGIGRRRVVFLPLSSDYAAESLPESLNLLAVCCEKMGHRAAANRALVLAYDYHWAAANCFGAMEQARLIGELHVHRRDFRMAAAWYLQAFEIYRQYLHVRHTDEFSVMPRMNPIMIATLLDRLGDVVYATRGAALVDFSKVGNDVAAREEFARQRLRRVSDIFEGSPRVPTIPPGAEVAERDGPAVAPPAGSERPSTESGPLEKVCYQWALELYHEAGARLRVLDVYLKHLRLQLDQIERLGQRARREQAEIAAPRHDGEAETDLTQRRANVAALAAEAVIAWNQFWQMAEAALARNASEGAAVSGEPLETRRYGAVMRLSAIALTFAASFAELNLRPSVLGPATPDSSSLRVRRILARVMGFRLPNDAQADRLFAALVHDPGKHVGPLSLLHRLNADREWLPSGNDDFLIARIRRWLVETGHTYNETDGIACRVLAEILLLGSALWFEGSLSGSELAAAHRVLGNVYTAMFALTLKLCTQVTATADVPAAAVHEIVATLEDLQVAAKRFLCSARDVYEEELEVGREERFDLGATYATLGALMFLRAEYLGCTEADANNAQASASLLSIPQPWHGEIATHVALLERDRDAESCARDTERYFKRAIEIFGGELTHYAQRYYFAHSKYYAHGDLTDYRTHHLICASVAYRHMPLENYDPRREAGSAHAVALREFLRDSGELARAAPLSRKEDCRTWYKRIDKLTKAILRINPRWQYFSLSKAGDEWTLDLRPGPSAASSKGDLIHRYFRSTADGLCAETLPHDGGPPPTDERPPPQPSAASSMDVD